MPTRRIDMRQVRELMRLHREAGLIRPKEGTPINRQHI